MFFKRPIHIDLILILIMIFAFSRSLLYALGMPPWGLLDEEQHYDYILKITQEGKPPIVTTDYIDEQVAASILQTERHTKFHWPEFNTLDTSTWGLEGISYEGYHGPVYYYFYSFFLGLMQGDILTKLFGLRILTGLLSSITIYLSFITTRLINSKNKYLPYLVALFIAVIPERTMLTARVSNDSLLEILSVLFVYIFTCSIIYRFKWKYVLLIAIITGLGITTKISFIGLTVLIPILFIINIKEKFIYLKAIITLGIIAVFVYPYFHFNLATYGDLTGYSGFVEVYTRYAEIWDPKFTWQSLFTTSWGIFSNFWIVWWKGADSVNNISLTILRSLLFLLTMGSTILVIKLMVRAYREDRKLFILYLSYLLSIISLVILTGIGYYNSNFNVIQGRFLIPVLFPIVFLVTLGSSQNNYVSKLLLLVFGLLVIFDMLNLFNNLIPYHYYFSLPFQMNDPLLLTKLADNQKITLFLDNFMSDKPKWVGISFVATVVVYFIILIPISFVLIRQKFILQKKLDGQ